MTLPLDLVPVQRDLTIQAGATFHTQFRWIINAVPQSMQGFRAILSIARRVGDAPVITVMSDTGDIAFEPADINGNAQVGVVDVVIPATQTTKLARASRYDLVLVDEFGDVLRIFEGAVLVNRGVTQVPAAPPSTPPPVATGPARRNLVLYRGDTFSSALTVKTPDGVPVDLTGSVPAAQARSQSGTLLTDFTVALEDQTQFPGRITFSLSSDQTTALPATSLYDLQVTQPSGEVRTLLVGALTIENDVTQVVTGTQATGFGVSGFGTGGFGE